MRAINIVTIINVLFVLALICSFPFTHVFLFPAAILALIAMAIHRHNNIDFDRIMLTLYVYIGVVIPGLVITCQTIPCYNMPDWCNIGLISYVITPIAVGIYTTFWTRAGFVGVISDDAQKVRKASLLLLCIAIALGLIVIYLGSQKLGWIVGLMFIAVHRIVKQCALRAQLNK